MHRPNLQARRLRDRAAPPARDRQISPRVKKSGNSLLQPESRNISVLFATPCRLRDFPDARQLAAILARMLSSVDCAALERVELNIVDDGHVAALHADYLGLSGPTNIISFPEPDLSAGSLFLSLDAVMRESRLYGQNSLTHLVRLLAHGLAHLHGYDHCDEMSSLEQSFFSAGLEILETG